MLTSDLPAVSFWDAVCFWGKLGCISFGGPAGQIALMHRELVERRGWISEQRFLHALNYCMLLPGPEAQQLATYIGWLLHGTWGGIVAGVLFILPSFVLLVGLSALYVTFGNLPEVTGMLHGVKPVVLAMVLVAAARIGQRMVTNPMLWGIALSAFVALTLFKVPFPAIVVVAGLAGAILDRWFPAALQGEPGHAARATPRAASQATSQSPRIDDHHEIPQHARLDWRHMGWQVLVLALLWTLPCLALGMTYGWNSTPLRMVWFFSSAAFVTFGGAYAVLPYVAQQAVSTYSWLQSGQMMDGLALGESTPGPLIMIVTFVGFLGGWQSMDLGWHGALLCASVATYYTFLPSFGFILVGGPWVEQLRGNLRSNAILTAISAAVVGVILHLAIVFGHALFFPHLASGSQPEPLTVGTLWTSIDLWSVALTAVAGVAIVRYRANILLTLAVGASGGAIVTWLRSA